MNKKKGLILVLTTAVISGFSIWINKLGVDGFNPYLFTGVKNFIVSVFLTIILFSSREYKKLLKIRKKEWSKLIIIGILGGFIPFLLFFSGLKISNSINAGFIHKTMFIPVGLMSMVFLKQKISRKQLILIGGLFLTAFLFFKNNLLFNFGDLLILSATILWSMEVILSKHLLKELSGSIVSWARMSFGSLFLLTYLFSNNLLTNIFGWGFNQWIWIILTSILLLGYVLTFYNGLKHVKAVEATSILLLSSVITSVLSFTTQINKIIGIILIPFFIYLIEREEYSWLKKKVPKMNC